MSLQGSLRESETSQDATNPYNWSKPRKWLVTLTACFITQILGINATSILSASEDIETLFGMKGDLVPKSCWVMMSWNLGSAVFPLFALPLMETFGIKHGYRALYLTFIIFIFPQALARNFSTLIVARIIAGGCAGSLQNITGGIISDVWQPGKLQDFAKALYIWALLSGASIGSLLGGLVMTYLPWRWIFFIQIGCYIVCVPLVLLGVPESRPAVIRRKQARHISMEHSQPRARTSVTELVRQAVVRPVSMLSTEWVILTFTIWSAFCYGLVFLFLQSFAHVYSAIYGWTPFFIGVVEMAVVLGETIGLLASLLQDHWYSVSYRWNTESPSKPIPEARLYLSIPISFIGLTIGLFWFAWTSYPHLSWVLPTIGLGFIGLGIFTVMLAVTNYFIDSYAEYAASALAAAVFGENFTAAFLPLAGRNLYSTLGNQWASSVLGFVALALSFLPVILVLFGEAIRRRSPFMMEATRG